MTPAEFKIRYNLLIDISSTGTCIKTDRELAHLCSTTTQYVTIVLQSMIQDREIDMASVEHLRHITYVKGFTRRRGTSKTK